jgi:hypothetical protein
VLFNGSSRAKENALLIVEAKSRMLTDDAAGQARAYALWLPVLFYLITNGEEIRVYLFQSSVQVDVMLMSFNRFAFREHWPMFYRTLNRSTVVERKTKLGNVLDGANVV